MMNMSATLTPAEFAATVGSDGRTVRKFLRDITPKEDQPGKGSRWALPGTKRDVSKLTKQFRDWAATQAEEKAKREAEKAAAAVEAANEVEEPEELETELDE